MSDLDTGFAVSVALCLAGGIAGALIAVRAFNPSYIWLRRYVQAALGGLFSATCFTVGTITAVIWLVLRG